MSTSQTITVTLSECCNKATDTHEGITVCTRCDNECDTYETVEDYYNEISADDSRGISDGQINNSLNELS